MTEATSKRADALNLTTEGLQEIYDYLDGLRESGVTNMYGAGAYLQAEFDMSRLDARAVLSAWMQDFSS